MSKNSQRYWAEFQRLEDIKAVEAYFIHPDTNWLGEKAKDGNICLVNFLQSLKSLRHLSLSHFNDNGELSSIPVSTLEGSDTALGALSSLELAAVAGPLWKRVASGATGPRSR